MHIRRVRETENYQYIVTKRINKTQKCYVHIIIDYLVKYRVQCREAWRRSGETQTSTRLASHVAKAPNIESPALT